MMPGGSSEAYKIIQPVVEKVSAQVNEGVSRGVQGCIMVIVPQDQPYEFVYWRLRALRGSKAVARDASEHPP